MSKLVPYIRNSDGSFTHHGSDNSKPDKRTYSNVCALRSWRSGGNAHFTEPTARERASFIFISCKDCAHV
ncbi:hypothetical protein SAMN05216315_13231 [Nitrosospira sp. Nsp18]|nr:hypothetical protein SAMN05216315_13231 [Nitrosospira sp. Nsp18]